MAEWAPLEEGVDFYWEGSAMVFTSAYHLRRGSCCGSCCRHCPYAPRWIRGTQTTAPPLTRGEEPPASS
jgi:hypothetical protein